MSRGGLVLALVLVASATALGGAPATKAAFPESPGLDPIIAKGWKTMPALKNQPKDATPGKKVAPKMSDLAALYTALRTKQFGDAHRLATRLPDTASPFKSGEWKPQSAPRLVEIGSVAEACMIEMPTYCGEHDSETYWSLLDLLRQRIEAYSRSDLGLADFYAAKDTLLLDMTSLWNHRYANDTTRVLATTDAQRKAIRAWVLKALIVYGDKALAPEHPDTGLLRGPSWSGTVSPAALEKQWVGWYGEPAPEEFGRLKVIVDKAEKYLWEHGKKPEEAERPPKAAPEK